MNVVSNLLASALLKRGSQIAKPPLRAAAAGTEVAKSSAKAPARGSAARRPRREERVDENGSQLPVASLRPALASSAAAEADQTAAAAFPPRRVRAPLEHVSDDAASQLPAASSLKPNRLASHQRDHAADAANAAAADAAANAAATSPAASRLRAVKRSAPLPAAELDTTETDNDATPSPAVLAAIDAAKSHVFKIAAPLRPLQAEAIAAAVTNRDVLLISGTGSGKSLTYLLPASLTPASEGCTVVVSPLVALIADQLKYCQGLASRSLVARALTGSVPLVQQRSTLAMVREGRVNVLFITPEQFVYKSSVLDALAARPPKRLVFDEAHCVVSWGESFRPSYMEACVKLRAALPDTRWTLATATAPPQVRSALVDLFPRPPLVLAASSTVRENLSYAIVPKPDFGVAQRIAALCGAAASLVYVMTKADADKLHAELAALGVNAVMYHAGMKLAEKRRAQEQWLAGKASMLIATPAFGMGVHHPAVRFVVHHSMPLSLSDYAQASGRAGRDGQPAHCFIFFSRKDYARAKRLVDYTQGDSIQLSEVFHMCALRLCVRLAIAEHMGEITGRTCGFAHCEACAQASATPKPPLRDEAAQPAPAAKAPRPEQITDDVDVEVALASAETLDEQSAAIRTRLLAMAKRKGIASRDVPTRAAIAKALAQGPLSRAELQGVAGWGPRKAELWSDLVAQL